MTASRAQIATFPGRNGILRALSPESLSKLRPYLEFVDIPGQFELRTVTNAAQFLYFLNDGVVSLIIAMEDGASAEIGVVGWEGIVGTPSVLGVADSPIRIVMQIAGNGYRINSEQLRAILEQNREIARVLLRQATIQGLQVAQVAGCNALHTAEQRLSRWLLMVQDRVALNPIPLTHEFLSILLGVTRPSVSVTVNAIAKKGAIRQEREGIRILNRNVLVQSSACECYGIIAKIGRRAFVQRQ